MKAEAECGVISSVRRSFDGLLIRALPALSAAVILVAGTLMTIHAAGRVR